MVRPHRPSDPFTDLRVYLASLPTEEKRELLLVLASSSQVRAHVIRQLHERHLGFAEC